MFWKKNEATDFERAKNTYYKYCYRNSMIPIKPLESNSEFAGSYVFLRNQFGLIAKIFFVQEKRSSIIKEPNHTVINIVHELQ